MMDRHDEDRELPAQRAATDSGITQDRLIGGGEERLRIALENSRSGIFDWDLLSDTVYRLSLIHI